MLYIDVSYPRLSVVVLQTSFPGLARKQRSYPQFGEALRYLKSMEINNSAPRVNFSPLYDPSYTQFQLGIGLVKQKANCDRYYWSGVCVCVFLSFMPWYNELRHPSHHPTHRLSHLYKDPRHSFLNNALLKADRMVRTTACRVLEIQYQKYYFSYFS